MLLEEEKMAKRISKRYKAIKDIVDKTKEYSLEEAVASVKKAASVKFDETVELAIKLGLDPKETTQSVRGTVALPHGTGKKVRVCVFCKGEKMKEAKDAGADFVGDEELVEKVKGGWCDFDVAIATPDMMKHLGALGKVLGPRGLMPNPKAGTVTMDVGKAINEVKAGRIEFKMDKQANVNVPVAKVSFNEKAIAENISTLIDAVLHAKPQSAKGNYIKSIYVSSTMGPGVKLTSQLWKKG